MGAKRNTVLAAAALAAAFAFASGQAEAKDVCSEMAVMQPDSIARGLGSMSTDVLGKAADLWSQADFANLLNNAAACDGKPEGMKYKVDSKYWRSQIIPQMQRVLPLSQRTLAIREAYAPHWKGGEPPSCLRMLSWKRDQVWLSDNSGDVFGTPFAEMDDEGRAMAAGFAKECVPVMTAALKANWMAPNGAAAISDDIAASAERESEAARERPETVAPSLRVLHDGRPVPLSYLGKRSRKMVEVASQAENAGRKLTTEEMIMLSKWAEKVVLTGEIGPERLYADAVRRVISNHLFNSK